ncbi:hypothetical protein [Pendulispora albinea]|uniref:Lipoprotein n=1 Tax=Pendulispora albinea TaxID=2741071 RepID=A0ABZ2LRI8_9BACT
MRTAFALAALGLFALSLTSSACAKKGNDEPLSQSEALEVVEEASLSSQASSLSSASIDISTNFTIGGAVEKAAGELRAFVGSQLPCADTTLIGDALSIVYGAKGGNCTYRGHVFSGKTQVKITRNDSGNVIVDHTWTDFSNGKIKLNGTAEVTWNLQNPSRRVIHHLVWTRLSDGRTGTGTGDRTDAPLDGDITRGVVENGNLGWEALHGRWDLHIQGLEMRWSDPVPQAGTLILETPKDQSVTITYARVDADSIKVMAVCNGRSFSFTVNALGIQKG